MIGFLILCSASISYSQKEFGSPLYILLHQLKAGLLPGVILGIICFFLPLEFFRKWSLHFMLFALFLTSMVFVPFLGLNVGGASRWISLGPLSFQPSEFLKIASIVYIAAWLSKWDFKKIKKSFLKEKSFFKKEWVKRGISFFAIIFSIILILALQPDFSTLGVIIAAAVSMYLVATSDIKNLLYVLIIIILFAAIIPLSGYRIDRILVFFNFGEADPMGEGYQLGQSLIAVGSGGLWGEGLGFGFQKLGFLPQPIADSIFAVFAEESGFIGSTLLILLFLLFVFLSFKISKQSQESFPKLLSIGIAVWIIIQAFINIGSVIGIVPLTGIPLPFIAYGGSHLTVKLIAVGLLLNASCKT
jgi:cell division protein FtsW